MIAKSLRKGNFILKHLILVTVFIALFPNSSHSSDVSCESANEITCNAGSFPATDNNGCGYCYEKQPKETTRKEIQVKIDGQLTCEVQRVAAHAGYLFTPTAKLMVDQIKGLYFEHSQFTGPGYVQGDYSCAPTERLLEEVDSEGKVSASMEVTYYTLTYQKSRGARIHQIERIEEMVLTLPNGNRLRSLQSVREPYSR